MMNWKSCIFSENTLTYMLKNKMDKCHQKESNQCGHSTQVITQFCAASDAHTDVQIWPLRMHIKEK